MNSRVVPPPVNMHVDRGNSVSFLGEVGPISAVLSKLAVEGFRLGQCCLADEHNHLQQVRAHFSCSIESIESVVYMRNGSTADTFVRERFHPDHF